MLRASSIIAVLALLAIPAYAQQGPVDSGVRGGQQNTAGYLQYRGTQIPHPPVISPNPTTGVKIMDTELKLFNEAILRAGQLEATCDTCADVPDGSPVKGELDPIFPQIKTLSLIHI